MTKQTEEGPGQETKKPRWEDRPIVERLLLSLIDANPKPEEKASGMSRVDARERRLKVAMSALFNSGTTAKGTQLQVDIRALRWMASQHHKDLVQQNLVEAGKSGPFAKFDASRLSGQYPPRSDRRLADDAATLFYGRFDRKGLRSLEQNGDASERLRRKWRKQREFWMDILRYSDDSYQEEDMHILIDIWTALRAAGIEIVPNLSDGRRIRKDLAERMRIPRLIELVISRPKP